MRAEGELALAKAKAADDRALIAHQNLQIVAVDGVKIRGESRPGKFGQGDKWISCLRAA